MFLLSPLSLRYPKTAVLQYGLTSTKQLNTKKLQISPWALSSRAFGFVSVGGFCPERVSSCSNEG